LVFVYRPHARRLTQLVCLCRLANRVNGRQKAESATPFNSIDLQEGEWYDYDEKAGEEVSITDVKWEIRRA
jgi:hypothetical protein